MKDIKNYEGQYAITSCGKVWSYKTKRFLKPAKNNDGYLHVHLCKGGKSKDFKIHRLVAETYIPNPNNLEDVDHIDRNREHNYIKNLQWMTHADNVRKSSNIKVRCVETGEIFDSITIAAKEKNVNRVNISKVCRGERKTCGDYHWEVI